MRSEGLAYVLGHTKEELVRLETQAAIFEEPTEEVLKRAGIREGMRVLDLGCGAGDVSMSAARMVGPTGSVLGVDVAEEALATARSRADAAGLGWLQFEQADIGAFTIDGEFDAIIGRFILMHVADPVAVIRAAKERLAPGGALAFIEMDVGTASAVPELPLLDQCVRWMVELYQRSGAEPNMGSHLYGAFRAAGLTPEMNGHCRVEAGPDITAPEYMANTIRIVAPNLERLGVVQGAEIEVDTLAERLREAAIAGDHCIIFPRLIGAWVPAQR